MDVVEGQNRDATYREPSTKRPSRQSLVFLGVSGLKKSGIGMAKTMRSRRPVLMP